MPKRTHDGVKKRCGCTKRQWPKCAHPWWFNFHYRGTEYRCSLDKIASARNEPAPTTKHDAVKWRDRRRVSDRYALQARAGLSRQDGDERRRGADAASGASGTATGACATVRKPGC